MSSGSRGQILFDKSMTGEARTKTGCFLVGGGDLQRETFRFRYQLDLGGWAYSLAEHSFLTNVAFSTPFGEQSNACMTDDVCAGRTSTTMLFFRQVEVNEVESLDE